MPVARIGKRGTMVLPAGVRRKVSIVEGDEMLIEIDERGTLRMMKKPKDFAAALRNLHKRTSGRASTLSSTSGRSELRGRSSGPSPGM